MNHFKHWIAWILTAALLTGMLFSCGPSGGESRSESDSRTEELSRPVSTETDPAESATEEETEPASEDPAGEETEPESAIPEPTLYERYRSAADRTVSLESEKIESDITLTFTVRYGEGSFGSEIRQQSTQIFSDCGGQAPDFYSDTTETRTMDTVSAVIPTSRILLWVKDGVAYVQRETGKTKTDDLSSLGLDSLGAAIHDDVIYRLSEEDLEGTASAPENGAERLSVVLAGGSAKTAATDSLLSLRALDLAFGVLDVGTSAVLLGMSETSDVSVDLTIDENGYFASATVRFSCRIPLSEDIQQNLFGTVIGEGIVMEIAVNKSETRIEPGREYSIELPEDADTFPEPYGGPQGAASLGELLDLLSRDFFFSEEAVACMSQEFLLACLSVSDPARAVAFYEERDFSHIASLLNEHFCSSLGIRPLTYTVSDYAEYEFTEEMRQDLLAFYQQNYNQIVEGYGETFARRVYEENEGLQAVVLVTYTTTDSEGVTGCPPADSSEGLSISLVNGRYYWNDFSLFQSLDGNS